MSFISLGVEVTVFALVSNAGVKYNNQTGTVVAPTKGSEVKPGRAAVQLAGAKRAISFNIKNLRVAPPRTRLRQMPLSAAVRYGDVRTVELSLQDSATDINKYEDNGQCPIHCAVLGKRLGVLHILMKCDSLDINKRTKKGFTALDLACGIQGGNHVLKALVDGGATISEAPYCVVSSLMRSCANLRTESARILLYAGTMNESDDMEYLTECCDPPFYGTTPLHQACQRGGIELVQLLAIFGADMIMQKRHTRAYTDMETADCDYDADGIHMMIENGDYDVGDAFKLAKKRHHNDLAEWIAENNKWQPLRIAAGSRLHCDAAMALKLGMIDPELKDGRGGNSYGGASSYSGWPTATVSDMLAILKTAMMPAEELPWNNAADVCPITVQLIKRAIRGWQPSSHWLHHLGTRIAVHSVLLVAERLRQTPNTPLHGPPDGAPPPYTNVDASINPLLPPEIWLLVLSFCCRTFWRVPYKHELDNGFGSELTMKEVE